MADQSLDALIAMLDARVKAMGGVVDALTAVRNEVARLREDVAAAGSTTDGVVRSVAAMTQRMDALVAHVGLPEEEQPAPPAPG